MKESDTHSVIIDNLSLARKMASTIRPTRHLSREDIVAEAYLALTIGANNLPVDHPNPTAYLAMCIRGRLLNLVKRMPSHEYAVGNMSEAYSDTNRESHELELTDFEYELMQLRLLGFEDAEIGTILGRSRTWVYCVRRDVYRGVAGCE